MLRHFSTLSAQSPICGHVLTEEERGSLNSYTFIHDFEIGFITCESCQRIVDERKEELDRQFKEEWLLGDVARPRKRRLEFDTNRRPQTTSWIHLIRKTPAASSAGDDSPSLPATSPTPRPEIGPARISDQSMPTCNIDDEDCEACQ